MLKYIKVIIPWVAMLLLAACDDERFSMYENDPKLYFFRGNYNYGEIFQNDSLTYSFRETGQDRDTIRVWGWTMGGPSGSDREFVIEQAINGGENEAKSGVHFLPFDDAGYRDLWKVPANAEKFQVTVIVLKDPSLDEQEVRLQIRFKENRHFKTGIPDQQNFVIHFSNMMTKPENWDTKWFYAFGGWSSDKMEFVMKYVGISDFANPPSDFGEYYYYKALAIQRLLEHPDEYPGLSFD